MEYRRHYRPGGIYFFTVVTHQRLPLFAQTDARLALRNAIKSVQQNYPFDILAWVLLPDHLHTIWQLPDNDMNFSERWRQIKRYSQHAMKHKHPKVWQKRFWEHYIRNEEDFANHMDYTHFNPVKHGYTQQAADWPYSTFHHLCKTGRLPAGLGCWSS